MEKPRDERPSVVLLGRHDHDDPLDAFAPEQPHFDWQADPAVMDFNQPPRKSTGLDADRVIHVLRMVALGGFVAAGLVLAIAGVVTRLTPATGPYSSVVGSVPVADAEGLRGLEASIIASQPLAQEAIVDQPLKASPTEKVPRPASGTTGTTPRANPQQRTAERPRAPQPLQAAVRAKVPGPPAPVALTVAAAPVAPPYVELAAARTPAPIAPPPTVSSENVTPVAVATTGTVRETAAAPVPGPSRDQSAIQSVVGHYRSAFSNLDATAAAAVWPSVDRKALDRAFSQLSEQSFDFAGCEISVNGERGAASCTGQARFVPKIGNRTPQLVERRWNFTLRKSSDDWVIDTVQAR